MKENSPLLSVIMPVFNAEKHLNEAIDSILSQTYGNFEFIIVNDGSTDSSKKIICSYTDNRIRLIDSDENRGIVYALNRGISESQGDFVARMDADDISLPTRFEEQVQFMINNPDIGICGSNIRTIDENGKNGSVWDYPATDEMIKCNQLFFPAIAHPTVIMRSGLFKKEGLLYEDKCPAEDYTLWVKAGKICKLYNINSILLSYRLHKNQISTIKNNKTLAQTLPVWKDKFEELGIQATERELDLHASLAGHIIPNLPNNIKDISQWALKLFLSNKRSKIYPEDVMARTVIDFYQNWIKSSFKSETILSFLVYWKTLYRITKKMPLFHLKKLFAILNFMYKSKK